MTTENPITSRSPVRRQWRGGASPVRRAFTADGRKRPARRLAALADCLCKALGQPAASLDELTRARIGLAAQLMLVSEGLHAEAAAGKPCDADKLVRISGALSRTLDDLGLSSEAAARRAAAEAEQRQIAEAKAIGVRFEAP